ncbi:MAG TPA: hypothetical protein DCY79_01290 [Planctomycetaceae bacterium]|nr:hypothetical protein [Planctomycetaceae bacterium]
MRPSSEDAVVFESRVEAGICHKQLAFIHQIFRGEPFRMPSHLGENSAAKHDIQPCPEELDFSIVLATTCDDLTA